MSGVATTQNSVLTPNIAAQASGALVSRPIPSFLGEPIHVKNFGAVGDGNSHPISGITEFNGELTIGWTLAQWQVIFPLAQSLSDEIDLLAFEYAAANLEAGSKLYIGSSNYVFNRTLNIPNSIMIEGGFCTHPGGAVIDPAPVTSNQNVVWLNHTEVGFNISANPVVLKGFGTYRNQPTPIAGPPAAPTLSSVSGGSLAATTYYVVVTYTNSFGQTLQSTESSLAVAAGNLLSVASPAASAGATGYNVFVADVSGEETLQNSTPIALGTAWTMPTTGLVSGAAPPVLDNSWQPNDNGYDILSNGIDTYVLDFFIINATNGIQFLASRPTIIGLRMQAFNTGIYSDLCEDTATFKNIHIWPFWSGAPGVTNWTLLNLTGIYLFRNDNPQISDTLVLGAAYGLRIGQSSEGTASLIHGCNLDLECVVGIEIDSTVTSTTSGLFTNVNSGANTNSSGMPAPGIPTSYMLQILGGPANFQFSNSRADLYAEEAVVVSGSGSVISFSNFWCNYNWVENTNQIIADVADGNIVCFDNIALFNNKLVGVPYGTPLGNNVYIQDYTPIRIVVIEQDTTLDTSYYGSEIQVASGVTITLPATPTDTITASAVLKFYGGTASSNYSITCGSGQFIYCSAIGLTSTTGPITVTVNNGDSVEILARPDSSEFDIVGGTILVSQNTEYTFKNGITVGGNSTIDGTLIAGTTTITGVDPFILTAEGLGSNTLSYGALTAFYSGIGVQSNATAASNTDAFGIMSSDGTLALHVSSAGDAGLAGTLSVGGGLDANGIALAVTPSVATLATNPPVSGTAYQWAGPGTLQLSCPVTLNPTSSAAATAALNIGSTSALGTQIDYSSRPAGLTAADGEIVTLKAEVPAGWYYGLTVTNGTIGTCAAVVH